MCCWRRMAMAHMELMYMGLVPEARGRGGWGVTIVRHAQWLVRQAGCPRVGVGR